MLTRAERLLAPASVETRNGRVMVALDVKTAELEKAFSQMRELWLASIEHEWSTFVSKPEPEFDWKYAERLTTKPFDNYTWIITEERI